MSSFAPPSTSTILTSSATLSSTFLQAGHHFTPTQSVLRVFGAWPVAPTPSPPSPPSSTPQLEPQMCFCCHNESCPWGRGADPLRKTTSWQLAYPYSYSNPLVFHVQRPGADKFETWPSWKTSPPLTPSFPPHMIRVTQACPIDPILLAAPPTTPMLNRLKSTMSARGVTKNRTRAQKSVADQLHASPRGIHHERRKCSNPVCHQPGHNIRACPLR